jgi:hypothetical protein
MSLVDRLRRRFIVTPAGAGAPDPRTGRTPSAGHAVKAAELPELHKLARLRDTGWHFLPVTDADGDLVEVRGVRTWPDSASADAVLIRYLTDAAGLRVDHDGGVVWHLEGGLAEVIDGLLALPAPGFSGAPRLVRGTSPSGLWLP